MHWSDHFDEWLERLGWPDLGDSDVWRWWFARCLAILEQHGWFELLETEEVPAGGHEGYPIQETYIALRWMAEDFCSAVDDSEYQPYWDEWLDAIGMQVFRPYESAKRHRAWPDVMETTESEAELSDPADYENDESLRIEDEETLESALALQSVLLVVAEKRKAMAKILIKAWGGPHRLYQSMYAAVHSTVSLYMPVEAYDDEDEDESQRGEGPEAFESMLKRWKGMEVNALANESLDVGGTLAEFSRKLGGHGWVYEGCPVRVQGYPEFYAYSSFY